MNIRDEEQLQQYFERGMTGAQEQNFLINVAARDDMRLAFRSQLELLKAVREDKDASGSPTFVRSKTLTALGLGGALVPSSLKEQEVAAASFSPTMWQNISNVFRRPAISLTAGLLAGILGSSFFFSGTLNQPVKPITPVVTAPAIVATEKNIVSEPAQQPATDRSNKSLGTHKTGNSTMTNHSTENPATPVIDNNNPGIKVGAKTNMHKPDENSNNQK